jgi:hypothetical protein
MRLLTIILLASTVVLAGCGDRKGGGTEPEARVARVEVDPAAATLDVGGTATLTAAVYDQNGARMSRTDVAWSSEAPGVATVQADGRVQAVAGGSARIVATVAGVQDGATLTVRFPVTQVRINRRYPSLFAGDTTLLAATLTRGDGSPATGAAAWTSGNPAVATVSDAGVVTGAAPGVATLRAASGAVQDEVTVVVLARRTGVNREIAYRSGIAAEYRMVLPGQPSTRISDPLRYAGHFAWAPGGDAFVIAYFGVNNDVQPLSEIRRVSGGTPVQLPGEFVRNADWRPDGGGFVFARFNAGGETDLYRRSADGTGLAPLTSYAGDEDHPRWSPDGRRIVFVRAQGNQAPELWVMAGDGSDARKLETGAPAALEPRWSPDGKYLAFHSCNQVWVIDSEGLAPARSVGSAAAAQAICGTILYNVSKGQPRWSPDGQKLVYYRTVFDDLAGPRDVVTVALDGTAVGSFRLSEPNGGVVWPDWSPDGTRIAFTARTPDQKLAIGTARPDGSDFRWVTEEWYNEIPLWRP